MPALPPAASALPPELDAFLFMHRMSVAAAASSLVSTAAGFPLDSVKSRLQVKRYDSICP
jgi:solute carrier family 25 carnitine/acylcarnitine transporter 20/29